ncbi:hypothetical protein PPSIR1_04578 [Plesiocystis pacifica SIR-1]|uniref:Uncharacterized protein n=1 Tax=Plesiocystis pacifica SIR-1 TaxID=391625 RepID=A6GBE5_9BACT|nr:hypothetical protein PPSIR1_04578 [Plesiocystis pacifica SIR-1]
MPMPTRRPHPRLASTLPALLLGACGLLAPRLAEA